MGNVGPAASSAAGRVRRGRSGTGPGRIASDETGCIRWRTRNAGAARSSDHQAYLDGGGLRTCRHGRGDEGPLRKLLAPQITRQSKQFRRIAGNVDVAYALLRAASRLVSTPAPRIFQKLK